MGDLLVSCEKKQLIEVRRTHWGIETGSYYRRDITLREDATRLTIGNGARVMANINNLIFVLIRQPGFTNAAQVRCFFAAHLSAVFSLLVTPFLDFAITIDGCGVLISASDSKVKFTTILTLLPIPVMQNRGVFHVRPYSP